MSNCLYNDSDPYACQWLINLIDRGLLRSGDVECCDFRSLPVARFAGCEQVHWFAGIGGWVHALDLAGVKLMPCWTASLPCQPFSNAGKRKGKADERHLFPEFAACVEVCQPSIIFGEQVASPDGREWLAGVHSKMEELGYAFAAADLCAAGVAAPHIRQRLYWGAVRLAHADGGYACDGKVQRSREHGLVTPDGDAGGLGNSTGYGRNERRTESGWRGVAAAAGFWGDFDILQCSDGKARRTGPGLFPLAHGVSRRPSKLRAYGNAIVPQVAAVFIQEFLASLEAV